MINRRALLIRTTAIAAALSVPQYVMAIKRQPDKLNDENKQLYHYKINVIKTVKEIIKGRSTSVYSYGDNLNAPVIKARQGQAIRIDVTNLLDEDTTVHWHGLRIPVHMDGVPHTGQVPIKPGETFTYYFTPPDAGTMWYHTHVNSVQQMG
ncbi:MAG: multicopper oxidase domain-containing protein [Pseudomonadales bacterium]|nr:multicopper oxidase domain-containing protein [Pseudomonadales bacterium]